MRKIWTTLLLITALGSSPLATAARTASDEAHALFDAYWEWQLREYPERATAAGDHRYDDRLTDFSEAALARRKAAMADFARQLRGIDRDALTGQDRISYDVLAFVLDSSLRHFAVFDAPDATGADQWLAVNQQNGPQVGFGSLPMLVQLSRFDSVPDYENYTKRLDAAPLALAQLTAGLKRAIARGWLPQETVVQRVPSQLDALLTPDPAKHPLYAPFERFPESISPADRERLAAAARAAIADKVVPALRELRSFYVTEYLPACTRGPGAAARPSWPSYYAAEVATLTTTTLTPREIHDLGLREVERIGREMDAVAKQIGFQGNRKEFADRIKSSPEFHYANGAEMLAAYREIAKRVEPALPRLFADIPRLPYGIRAMPAAEGENAERYVRGTADGSRPGYFEANVNNPARRAKGDMVTLFLHEGVPGHHLQVARAMELHELPMFRRQLFLPAYGEGWALYAESLGEELGLYADPFAKFGYLSAEMFRASRLVVDTGINALGWRREKAIRYLADNTGIPDAVATAEVDRYYVQPAQALAYKIGELRIKALRAKAEAALGARFDIRRFHNALIDDGPLPLSLLERRIDDWIARNRQ
jgi:uncharacterized protein (DUF885 family)